MRSQLYKHFKGMMNALYKEEGAELRIDVLAEPEMVAFIDAHAGVLNEGMSSVEMSDSMRQRLERSNWVFSGMKTFHELKEAWPSMLDDEGNRKPFNRFLTDVKTIDETYNGNYLRAEYNFIVGSAEMAAKWERFSEDGDRYNLQYRTAGDDKVRPEHADMNGITLPMDDPFWEDFYPPNGWNCRCDVVQVRKSKYAVTPSDEAMALGELATGKDKKGMLKFNAGIRQATVPDYNPYTVSQCNTCDRSKLKLAKVPKNELCAACAIVREMDKAKHELKEQRSELKKWCTENLMNKTIAVHGIQSPVKFTMTGIKEALNQPHKRIVTKNNALKDIVRLIAEGEYVRADRDQKNNPMVHKYHYIKINIGNDKSYAVIRELKDGKANFYSIVEKIKERD